MASIKNLKKDINYTLGDIVGECDVWAIENPNEDVSKSEAIIEEAFATFDALLDKVNAKNIENKKLHFKGISKELEEKAKSLVDKLNNL
ncbi:conserved hypothetical protein [Tenacibaculum litopenaei]|jgi:hypothetical protein|uniref:hypothetical protein n=1 Tax=Tenacibaculum litopenaei TaxID=396016 RepID=UPI0038963332